MSIEEVVQVLVSEVREMRNLLEDLGSRQRIKEFYSTEEFARAAGYDSAKTVRDYLASGRLNGIKKRNGRGRRLTWAVPHDELLRHQREGLLPPVDG